MVHIRTIKSFILWLLGRLKKAQVPISKIEQYVIDFIRELRVSKGLTQEDIGSILNLSRSFIKNIESSNQTHKYNLTHINALADYFEMSPTEFLPKKPFEVNPVVKDSVKSKSKTGQLNKKKSPLKKTPLSKK